MTTRVLTGITTSGTPHLGNYAGAIRPAIQASTQPGVDAFFFLADYHALIKCVDPERVVRSRLEIAATWIAAGLDADRVTFYRQSDIPEIPELCWMLSCVTAKGLMNRAHAYKASVDANVAGGVEPDDGITMGLFSYPVLMAADILMFNAHKVPVGRDQIQHLEMTRDIAQRFNHLYGAGQDLFTLPEVQIDEEVATLPGLDGRKMSKSYNNTIPLFEGGARALNAAISRIVTDSRKPGEPKDAEGSHLYALYQAFATHEASQAFRRELEQGMGWGEAKRALAEKIEAQIGPMRDTYAGLMARPGRIEDILQAGATRARALSRPLMERLREAVGLRQLQAEPAAGGKKARSGGVRARARMVSFRDEDGQFRFRLFAADGTELLLSEPFGDPKELHRLSRQLVDVDLNNLVKEPRGLALQVEGQVLGYCPAERLDDLRVAQADLAAGGA
ncbi:MAG: tryptophan--tRNA ligase [Alcaligenaceae bacterium]|nr:tryptophan--tRNA ligase [Alcaligenaceae bacterium]